MGDKLGGDVIFEPLKWRNIGIKNRIFRSSISGRWDNEDGSLTQVRVNWESQFAKGGVGAIISSFVPVLMAGRILPNYGTIHRDDFIPLWAKVGEAVHKFGCKFIMQLSHSGRQLDMPGISNQHRISRSSTSRTESLNGILTQAMTQAEIDHTVKAFADGAWRAREAGLDGVELHASHGYLITQFLSSGINDRKDGYGGELRNRARFLLEIIGAIRDRVGRDYHLQVKLNAIDYNNVIPWEKKGNTLDEGLQLSRWVEEAGADALHISEGSLFPHPLIPPGDFDFDTIEKTYDTVLSSGIYTFRNYLSFRYRVLRPIFRWLWFRMKKGHLVEGVGLEYARAVKKVVSIPVINTGGYQNATFIRKALSESAPGAKDALDGVSIARSLIANPDLPQQWQAGRDLPLIPCTYCNKCLLNAPKNPLGCYELSRYGGDYDKMLEQILSIYKVRPDLVVP
jgi:2,4-dienoyl-CoA reductase-like NADH-dependent reductase (Old Yellow Enzyme family)